jgi:hypothetical protein
VEAYKRTNQRKEDHPKTKFEAISDAGNALLSTPQGRAVSFFLFQHKAQLGLNEVKSIAARGSSASELHMIFEIGPVAATFPAYKNEAKRRSTTT